jgi:hypothetical protein
MHLAEYKKARQFSGRLEPVQLFIMDEVPASGLIGQGFAQD